MILLPTCSACSKPSVFTRSSITSMICDAYCRRSWSAPLRPTQRILTVLPAAVSAVDPLAREPHDRRVERAAQAALGGADHQQMHLVLAGAGQQPRRRIDVGDGRGDVAQHLLHALGIGPRGFGRRLRAAQLRRRDHLHGLGDLLRRLGRGDADAHVLEAGHSAASDLSCVTTAARAPPPLRGRAGEWGKPMRRRTGPHLRRASRADLPLKGGGEERQGLSGHQENVLA